MKCISKWAYFVVVSSLLFASALPAESQSLGSMTAARTSAQLGANDSPISVIIFADFESFESARCQEIIKGIYDQSDDLQIIFKHTPAARNHNSHLAHEASLAAAAQGRFWEMQSLLFRHQTNLTRADLISYALELNLDISIFRAALDQHTYKAIVDRDLAEAAALGVTATPTIFVNGRRLVGQQGYSALGAVIETLRASRPKLIAGTEKIEASGPSQTIRVEASPSLGKVSAPVTIVEFSDFECPFCAEAAPIVRQIAALYPTQVCFYFKNYPLQIHKEALLAHQAALAANAQGKFWEMHDLLFSHQEEFTREVLIKHANSLGLDVSRFIKDLDSKSYREAIGSDKQEGDRVGVDGTPYFFVNGHGVSGVLTLDQFRQVIETSMKETHSSQQ